MNKITHKIESRLFRSHFLFELMDWIADKRKFDGVRK
jgi:hypothetical protein